MTEQKQESSYEQRSFDELEARTTIRFPKPIRERLVKKLFHYVADRLGPCSSVHYNVESHENIESKHDAASIPTGEHFLDHGSQKISGVIHTFYGRKNHRLLASASFSLERSIGLEDLRAYDYLKFFTTPGYELGELNQSEVELMDDIHRHAESWFETNFPGTQ